MINLQFSKRRIPIYGMKKSANANLAFDLATMDGAKHFGAERGYVNAKHLVMLQKAGMAEAAGIPPRWAPLCLVSKTRDQPRASYP